MKKVFLSFLLSMGLSWGMDAEQEQILPLEIISKEISTYVDWKTYRGLKVVCKHWSKELKGEGQVMELEHDTYLSTQQPLGKYIAYLNQYPMVKGVQFNGSVFNPGKLINKEEEFAHTLLTHLKSMQNIQELILINFAVSNDILNKIVEIASNLKKLVITGNSIADKTDLPPLQSDILLKLPQLKMLCLCPEIEINENNLTQLLRANNLEELSLMSSHLKQGTVNILGQLSKLTNLKILLPPEKMEKYEQRFRPYYPLYDLPIPTPPNLKQLVVKRMSFNEKSITSLFKLTALETLGLTDNNRLYCDEKRFPYNNAQSFNQVVSRLKEFTLLIDLDFSYSYFNSDSVNSLAKLTNLKRLKLDHCTYIKAGELTPLSQLLSLEALSLIKTDINADDLQAICKLENLINLNVAGCKNLTSADFLSLGNLRNLQILNLVATNVNDMNDDVLDQLLPNLPYLTVLTLTIATDYRLNCRARELLEKQKTKEIKNKYPNIQIIIPHFYKIEI